MLIQYCSDLHLEFPVNKIYLTEYPIDPIGEILVLAGDIMLFSERVKQTDFLKWASDHFRHTYWVPGNHEYYRSDLNNIEFSFKENILDNVTLLNNKVIESDNVRLVFTTLWSAIDPGKEVSIRRSMADFHLIRRNGNKISIEDYQEMHETCVRFLYENLANNGVKKTIVVTHHLPTFMNYPVKYKTSDLNSAFATELSPLIREMAPDYWVFGHHHQPVDEFRIGNTCLLNNQLGYVEYNEHRAFRRDATISI